MKIILTDSRVYEGIENWQSTLEEGNVEDILNLYHHDAVLWDARSPFFRTNRAEIAEYYQELLKDNSFKVKVNLLCLRQYNSLAIMSCICHLKPTGTSKALRKTKSTFVFINEDMQWLILDHHLSSFSVNQIELENQYDPELTNNS